MMRPDDEAVSTVVGAILVLAALGLGIVYVNAYHVPSQGEALDVQAREAAQAGLASARGTLLADPSGGARSFEVPLRAPEPSPPLLSGVVLSPALGQGTLSLNLSRTNVTISHVTRGSVTPGDPMRTSLGGGFVRVYDLGNASAGFDVGSLGVQAGGAYLAPVTYRLEAGALLADRGASSGALQPPALAVTSSGGATRVAWRLPVLAGAPTQVSGGAAGLATLTPGPLVARGGGEAVYNVTIVVKTDALQAWNQTLGDLVGSRGTVTASGSGDSGTVTAFIPSPGAAPGVQLDLSLVRFDTSLAVRSAG